MSVFSGKLKMLSRKVWKVRNQLAVFREKCHRIVCETLGAKKGGMIDAIYWEKKVK